MVRSSSVVLLFPQSPFRGSPAGISVTFLHNVLDLLTTNLSLGHSCLAKPFSFSLQLLECRAGESYKTGSFTNYTS